MASNKSSSKRQASLLAFVEKPSKHTRVMHSPPDNGVLYKLQTVNIVTMIDYPFSLIM